MITWITGASSGIGKSLSLAIARNKNESMIETARDQQKLSALRTESDNITTLSADIAAQNAVSDLSSRLSTLTPRLDRVILNAGTCEYLDFPDPDWSAVRRLMEVNFFGTLNCLQAALPLLRKSDRAHIVVIASQVTGAPFPRAEAYGASKAALQYFFDSLRIDLAIEKIDVTIVNPGFVDTPLTRQNDFSMPFLMDVETAAKRIIENIESRPAHYRFPRRLSLLLFLSKCLPGLWRKMVSVDRSGATTGRAG